MEDHHLQRLEIHFKRQMLKEEVKDATLQQ